MTLKVLPQKGLLASRNSAQSTQQQIWGFPDIFPGGLPNLPGLPGLPGGGGLITAQSRFTPDFTEWLKQNGYGDFDFVKNPRRLASFGGRQSPGEPLTHEPVIFFHGNTDSAASLDAQVAQYKAKGYKDNELYVMTWGDASLPSAGNNYHSRKFVSECRAFIQAVQQYTGSPKVDVVAHSMGVTLARKAIKGGKGNDGGEYDLGAPLTDIVDTFVGISGANRGLDNCSGFNNPTCSTENGFAPDSRYLRGLNEDPTREGDHVYAIYSLNDGILGRGRFGARVTGPIANEDGERVLNRENHFQARDQSVDAQIKMIQDHQLQSSVAPGIAPDLSQASSDEELEWSKAMFPSLFPS